MILEGKTISVNCPIGNITLTLDTVLSLMLENLTNNISPYETDANVLDHLYSITKLIKLTQGENSNLIIGYSEDENGKTTDFGFGEDVSDIDDIYVSIVYCLKNRINYILERIIGQENLKKEKES